MESDEVKGIGKGLGKSSGKGFGKGSRPAVTCCNKDTMTRESVQRCDEA